MSREQRLALDAKLRKAPQTFGPVPVERLREGDFVLTVSGKLPARWRATAGLMRRPAPIFQEPLIWMPRLPATASRRICIMFA